jgi:transcription-repair coupling factor (superfamily II helicase)
VPGDAHLPAGYVAAEDARLEAYRRLAAATTAGEVDDVADEWADRYGPLPAAAEGLLGLGRLRVECLRVGVTDVTVVPARVGGARQPVAKLSPLDLPASAQVRLRRLVPGATYREELHQLVLPLAGEERPAEVLRSLLAELVPPPSAPSRVDRPGLADAGIGGAAGSMPDA